MNEGGTESYGTGPADDHTYGTTNEGEPDDLDLVDDVP